MLYAISTEWLEQRIIEALQSVLSIQGKQEITTRLFFIGSMSIDGSRARSLLPRARIGRTEVVRGCRGPIAHAIRSGPRHRVLRTDPGSKCIAANLIMTLPRATDGSAGFASLDKSFVETFFRSNLGLALGGTALTLVENADEKSEHFTCPESRSCLCSANSRSTVSGYWWTRRERGCPG